MPMRRDRPADALRPTSITPGYLDYAEGSALIACGNTRVLCAATVEPGVPDRLAGKGSGWITAEYAMLPRSTARRTPRETHGLGGRTQEIRRLIGRSLRAAVAPEALGEHTIIIDCDVIQADGGTRTAAITGGYVALALATRKMAALGMVGHSIALTPIAAVSAGIVKGELLLDLCYEEDSRADVDLNVVMNAKGAYVEVQGTGEGSTFTREELDRLLDLAASGIDHLLRLQQDALQP
ncbi:MAG: ribonuclease PH [Anaerolineae bacterium]